MWFPEDLENTPFSFYLRCKLICQKTAHFLSAQMVALHSFLQMFIVLGM